MNGMMLIKKSMKKEVTTSKLLEILKERKKTVEKGYPQFDRIEEIVKEVIDNNIKRIASSEDVWKIIKPYVDEAEYKEANGKMAEAYRQLQKLEYKMNRLKEKTMKELEDEVNLLGEFEDIGQVFLEEDKVFIDVVDKIENYKQHLREQRNEK